MQNTIRDEKILEYLKKHSLFAVSKDFGITQEHLYSISKNLFFQDKEFAEYILKFFDPLYFWGYKAYVYAHEKNEQEIDDIINLIEIEYYELHGMIECYVNILLEVGISIVEFFPYKSLQILKSINETYEILGSTPIETLDLSVDIVCVIAKDDLEKALELFDETIEVDYYKYYALKKIDDMYNLENIKKKIDEVSNIIMKYDKDFLLQELEK